MKVILDGNAFYEIDEECMRQKEAEKAEEAKKEASETMDVTFVEDVDKEAFRQATAGMISDYCSQYPGVQTLLDIINSAE